MMLIHFMCISLLSLFYQYSMAPKAAKKKKKKETGKKKAQDNNLERAIKEE